MSIDVIIVLLFAPVVAGLLYAGFRIQKDERRLEAAASAAVPAGEQETSALLTPRAELAAAPSWAIYEIERRLRRELTLARAFSADPSPEALWLR